MIDQTTSTPCPWDELISALLDGELDETEVQALEAHLADHAECRSELDELARVRQRVRTLPMRSGTPAFWLRVVDDVASDRPSSSPTAQDRAAVASPARLRWASVAASVVILAAGIAGTRGGGAPATPGSGTTASRAAVIAGITATRAPAEGDSAGEDVNVGDGTVVVDVTSTTIPGLGSDPEWLQELADAINDVLN